MWIIDKLAKTPTVAVGWRVKLVELHKTCPKTGWQACKPCKTCKTDDKEWRERLFSRFAKVYKFYTPASHF